MVLFCFICQPWNCFLAFGSLRGLSEGLGRFMVLKETAEFGNFSHGKCLVPLGSSRVSLTKVLAQGFYISMMKYIIIITTSIITLLFLCCLPKEEVSIALPCSTVKYTPSSFFVTGTKLNTKTMAENYSINFLWAGNFFYYFKHATCNISVQQGELEKSSGGFYPCGC